VFVYVSAVRDRGVCEIRISIDNNKNTNLTHTAFEVCALARSDRGNECDEVRRCAALIRKTYHDRRVYTIQNTSAWNSAMRIRANAQACRLQDAVVKLLLC